MRVVWIEMSGLAKTIPGIELTNLIVGKNMKVGNHGRH